MKSFITFTFAMVLIISRTASQSTASEINNLALHPTNYVVIGAFAIHKNAIRFTTAANKKAYTAKYEMNYNRKLYYVYIMKTDDHQVAIDKALQLQSESPYDDTWVYNGLLGKEGESLVGIDFNPKTKHGISEITGEEAPDDATQQSLENAPNQESQASSEDTGEIEESEEMVGGKKFFLKIFRGDNQSQIEGDVLVIDAERARKIGTFAGNKDIRISDPGNKGGRMSFTCEVFGYRKIQHNINYHDPEVGGVLMKDSAMVVVPFELVRLQKGDISTMYNVYFFKDAAVMRPESRYEVNNLLEMLQENKKYKIKIHGHTNGGAHGKIISLNKDSSDHFSLNNTKDALGSAKKLSEERADVIRDFLGDSGVDLKRMQVKAWGGKRPIYDKHSPQAQSNVRVEIEILEN